MKPKIAAQPIYPIHPFAVLADTIRASFRPPAYADGWRSREEIAVEMGKSIVVANTFITQLKKAKLVEVWDGQIDNGQGGRVRATRYRVKN